MVAGLRPPSKSFRGGAPGHGGWSQPPANGRSLNRGMHPSVARVKEEVRKILAVAIFFSVAFCLIVLADRLLMRGSGIEIAGYARAIVGGLIVAKVLLIVDLLPLVHAFPGKPLVHNIVWKSTIYVAASIVYRYLEPLVKFLFKGAGLAAAHHGAIGELAQPRFWAIEIWLAMLLVVFVTMRELTRVVGNNTMKLIFFGVGDKSAAEIRFRDAA